MEQYEYTYKELNGREVLEHLLSGQPIYNRAGVRHFIDAELDHFLLWRDIDETAYTVSSITFNDLVAEPSTWYKKIKLSDWNWEDKK